MTLTIYNQLFWLLLLIPVVLGIVTTLVNRKAWKCRSAAALRVMAIVFLILALCRPFLTSSSDNVHVVYLVDVSQSIDLESVLKLSDTIKTSVSKLKSGDSHDIYIFGNGVRKTSLGELTKTVEAWNTKISDDQFRSKSAIVSAFESIKMVYPANKIKRLCLFSDGVETESDLKEAIREVGQENIALSFATLERLKKPEVSVVSLQSNTPRAYKGEVVKFTAKLLSNYTTDATVKFITKGVVIHERPVKLEGGKPKSTSFEIAMSDETSGIWETEISAEKDYFPINNTARCSTTMQGEAKLLALHKDTAKLREFRKALEKQGISVDLRGKFGIPASLQEMNEFDAIMLADIEATNFTARQMENMRKYVTEFGGGLIMTGSENSFGLGGYYKTPIEEVLPVTSRYEKEKEHPSLAIVLVIDKSGSMGGQPIVLVREASKAAVELLSMRDQVGVVAFDGDAKVICDLTSAASKGDVMSQVDTIAAGGGTNMYPAMAVGRDMLAVASAKIKHMIVLSDGQSSGGDFEGVSAELADMGVTVSTVSLGQGAAVQLMATIAEIGHGRAYVTNNAEEMPRIFTKETMEASRSAIKEEPFMPVKIADSDYLQGMDIEDSPFLLGYVMTKVKPTAQVQLLTEAGDPLLASARFGLGQSVAFTSDATEQWAGEWQEWSNFGKFWAQVIRATVRSRVSHGFTTKIEAHGTDMKLHIYRHDEQGNPENHIEWDAMLMDDNGSQQRLAVDEVGFGHYTALFNAPADSNYTIRINDKTNNRLKTVDRIKSYPKEYLLSSEKDKALDNVAAFTETEENTERKPVATQEAALNLFALLAVLCILGSTVLRRI